MSLSIGVRLKTKLRLRELLIEAYHDPINKSEGLSINHISEDKLINGLLDYRESHGCERLIIKK